MDRWYYNSAGEEGGRLDRIDQSLSRLAFILARWHESIQFGPIPGAYLQLVFHRHLSPLATVSVAHLIPMVSQFQPAAVTAWCDTGTLTAQLHYTGPNALLSATLAVSSTPIRRQSGADFTAVSVLTGSDVWMEIVSIDSGTPTELVVVLTVRDIGKANA